jgi:RNA polymerase subunit RPABC4/transcription elongation factor Spt4
MTDSEPIQCPVCSWTGQHDDLDETADGTVCPVCHQTLVVE